MIGLGMANPLGNMIQNHTQNALNNSSISVSNYDDIIELLRKLGELKALGVLTDQEFDMKKTELLSKIK